MPNAVLRCALIALLLTRIASAQSCLRANELAAEDRGSIEAAAQLTAGHTLRSETAER